MPPVDERTYMRIWSDPVTKTVRFEGAVTKSDVEGLDLNVLEMMMLQEADGTGRASDWLLALDLVFSNLGKRVEGKS